MKLFSFDDKCKAWTSLTNQIHWKWVIIFHNVYISTNDRDPKSSNLAYKFNYFEGRRDGFENNYKDFWKWRRHRVGHQRELFHEPQVWMHHSSAHTDACDGSTSQAGRTLCVPFTPYGPRLYERCADEGICRDLPWTFPVWDWRTSCDFPSSTIIVTDYFYHRLFMFSAE